jgi:hypothetical protein
MVTLPRLFQDPASAVRISSEDWGDLLPRLKFSGLLAHFGALLARGNVDTRALPPAVQRQLAAAASNAWVRERSTRWECGELARLLRETGIPVMLVKGASYLMTGALPGRGRYLDDVDLLVPEDSLPEVERLLLKGGWEPSEPDPEKTGYYREWLHQIPPFIHPTRQAMVDVHHTIIAPWGGHVVDVAALFRDAVPSEVPGLLAPSPIDRCLIVSAHFIRNDASAGAFRDLLDFDELLREAAPDEAGRVALQSRARAIGLQKALATTSQFASALFGTPTFGRRPLAVGVRARALIPEGINRVGRFTKVLRRGKQIAGFRAALPLRVMAKRTIERRLGLKRQASE